MTQTNCTTAQARTLYAKLVDSHTVSRIDENTVLLYCDIHFANEYTSPQAFSGVRERGLPVLVPDAHLCVVDHIIPTHDEWPRRIYDEASRVQALNMKKNCEDFGIEAFYGPESPYQGVEHVVMEEQGLVRPGMVVICGDSHTTTHGAFGAMGTGCGATDMATILMTGELWFRVPEIIEVRLDGEAQKGVYPKDVILEVLGRIRADGAVYKAIDFTGSYVEQLNVAGRMTICNMAVEMGAKTAYMQPNADVLNYVDKRAVRPYEVQFTDPDFQYEESYVFDVSKIEPNLACPSSVENVHPLSEVVANGPIKLNQGYIGSCTGGRVEDIAIAAKILKGRHIPEYTRLIVVPASNEVMQECMKAGYIQDLMNAGATITTPGCGACLGAHEGILAPGEVCITSTNRNFPGRMGSTEALMYLASPATVAASMVNGCITDPRDFL